MSRHHALTLRALRHLGDWLQLFRARAIVHWMQPARMTDAELHDWLCGRHVELRPEIAIPMQRGPRIDWSQRSTASIEHRGRVS